MSGVVGAWGLNATAETEEFLAAVARQSIGRPCALRPSKNLEGKIKFSILPPPHHHHPKTFAIFCNRNMSVETYLYHIAPTERQIDGVKASLRPVVRSTSYVNQGGAPRDSIFKSQIGSVGASTGRAGNKMTTAEIPVSTEKGYHARPSHAAPSTVARTTLSSSAVPLRRNPIQQPRAVPMAVTMAIPTAHSLVHEETACQPQLPLATPWKDLADRWARELDAARERRKELKEQFRRDFGMGCGGH